MFNLKGFGFIVVATTTIAAASAETNCPGYVPSVPFHLVNRYQMVVDVSIDHNGPYRFLLDTGTQITMIDTSLAAALHLAEFGSGRVAGAGTSTLASFSQIALVEAGRHEVKNMKVYVYDLSNLQAAAKHIQGVLGEDFLEHFDMLIDNVHNLLCLDDSGVMGADVRGPRTVLEIENRTGLPELVIVEARLSDATRPVHLLLDSGADGAILYNSSGYLDSPHKCQLRGTGVDGTGLLFSTLPPQDVKIGSLRLRDVPFVSLVGTQKDARAKRFDGVLTFGVFRRVFITHAGHFAVLDPL